MTIDLLSRRGGTRGGITTGWAGESTHIMKIISPFIGVDEH